MATGDDAHKDTYEELSINEVNKNENEQRLTHVKDIHEDLAKSETNENSNEQCLTCTITNFESLEKNKSNNEDTLILSSETSVPVEGVCLLSSKEETERLLETRNDISEDIIDKTVIEVTLEEPTLIEEKPETPSTISRILSKDDVTLRVVDSIRFGIQRAIAEPTSRSERDLLMQDFMTVESTPFSSTGTPSPQSSSRFLFKTYAPVAFRHFRELFGIRSEDFLESICQKELKEQTGSGKSGSVFYLTGDDRFIIKTMQSKECSFLQKLLPGYYMNVHQNPDTLLPKYFGLYCYQCDRKKIKLVTMNNLLPSSVNISQRYDLKGATYKRRTVSTSETIASITYKDLDFMQHHPDGLYLDTDTYNVLMQTIKRDCTVLESFKIIDYSLLLGVSRVDETSAPSPELRRTLTSYGALSEDNTPETDNRRQDKNDRRSEGKPTKKARNADSFLHRGLPALDGEGKPILIFIGIIDILQSYRLKKKLEHAWKSVWHDGSTVSVHRPDFYSSRFQRFMAEKVFKRLSAPPVRRKTIKLISGRSLRDAVRVGEPSPLAST